MLSEDELREKTLLVIANKQDLPTAMETDEITDKLGLNSLKHKWLIQPTSATTREGLAEGFNWLMQNIAK